MFFCRLTVFVCRLTVFVTVQVGLSAPDVASLLSAMVHRPETEAATLESAAALLGGCRPELTARALRAASELLLRAAEIDWDRVAALQTRSVAPAWL